MCSQSHDIGVVIIASPTNLLPSPITVGETKPIMSNENEPIVTDARKTRIRESVLLKITPAKLASLIGDDEIGVSRKELRLLVINRHAAGVLSKSGL